MWSLILFFGMLMLPETPRFLIKQDKADRAAKALSALRRLPVDHEAIAAELADVQVNHETEKNFGQSSYLDCFRGPVLKRQLTGMGLQALQQLTGKFDSSILQSRRAARLQASIVSSSTCCPFV